MKFSQVRDSIPRDIVNSLIGCGLKSSDSKLGALHQVMAFRDSRYLHISETVQVRDIQPSHQGKIGLKGS